MQGDPKVIEYLNDALKNELTAINQYFLHYRLLDHWGVERLAKFEYDESIDEMKHADWLAERILFLEGHPNFQLLGRLRIGETVEEVLKSDLALENEEEHVDTLERLFDQIKLMGLQNFVQLQSKPAEE